MAEIFKDSELWEEIHSLVNIFFNSFLNYSVVEVIAHSE